MPASETRPVVTGLGITCATAQGAGPFFTALLEGRSRFAVMRRPGRQSDSEFLGAEIEDLEIPATLSRRLVRGASWSGQVALATLHQAWQDAGLAQVDPRRIGLVVGGSNVQQRAQLLTQSAFSARECYVSPSYAVTFMDSDLCGLCSEQFNIKGFTYTLGAASASGNLAIIAAAEAVIRRDADICIAIGALMDLSHWELQGLRSIGAMGSDRFASQPSLACRPFDRDRDGFIFGEACGVVVVEAEEHAGRRGVQPYGQLCGWALGADGNRNPNPSWEGEAEVIRRSLTHSGWNADEVDYVNPHGSGSVVGDVAELEAIRNCGLSGAYINATKSLIGHSLSAAGCVECIATLLQMNRGCLHPSRNLDNPIDKTFNWVGTTAIRGGLKKAVNLSFGFGGINSSLCLRSLQPRRLS